MSHRFKHFNPFEFVCEASIMNQGFKQEKLLGSKAWVKASPRHKEASWRFAAVTVTAMPSFWGFQWPWQCKRAMTAFAASGQISRLSWWSARMRMGWTLAKVVSWSSNVSITGYAKELRTLPLKLRDCCAEERRIFSLCEQHDEWTKFSMFSTQDQDRPLCKLDTVFFFELWGFENLFACLGRKVDRRRRIRGLPKKASRITSTLDVWTFIFSTSTQQYFRLENQALHMEMERTHEFFARGILWCAGFLRWSLLQNDELFDWNLTDFNLWQLKHIETEVDTSVAGANYKRLHKSSPRRLRQIIPSEVFP